MSIVALVVVVAFSLALIAFAAVTFAKPAVSERFLTGFASSARTHYAEQIVRVLVGAALVVRAPAMCHPAVFSLVGWAIAVSSTVLLCLPWRWHQRLGTRMLPRVGGAFAAAVLLLLGVSGSNDW